MINALSIDLEYWHSAELVRKYVSEMEREDQVVEATMPIVDLLDKYKTRATFFVLGIVADRHPELVKAIFDKGHEIASHSYSHKMLHELGREEFEEEMRKSVDALYAITGERPIGFRAPTYSLNNSTSWALKVLIDHGFKYDSSIFPIQTRLYGVPKAPLHPYKPSLDNIIRDDPDGEIVEFPMTAIKIGLNVPISGGFYFRALPFWLLKLAIRRVNRTRPAVIYVHPWEIYPNTPRLGELPISARFITYFGINRGFKKLEHLLAEFEFKPLRNVLQLELS